MKKILVTGGLGYIGSHTCIELAAAGYAITVLDNLCNSKASVLGRLCELTGKPIAFHRVDVRDGAGLHRVFSASHFDAVLHFAALKAVRESVQKPALYHENNVDGTKTLLAAMARHEVKRIVFSSSATVYGDPERLPIDESHPLRPKSPYGKDKVEVERLLEAHAQQDAQFLYAVLRYFNPIGAHPSGRIGEDPRGIPNNLLPYVAQVAVGNLPRLSIYGNRYPTADGTGVRDYIHVMDLARGHVAALDHLFNKNASITVNLGTGKGYSVLEVVKAFERACGKPIPFEVVAPRPGDTGTYFANPERAAAELGWRAQCGIVDMCRDAWRWQSANPNGYPE